MKFTKGTPKPPNSGRRPGVQNRATRAVRDALVEAFDRAGGVDFLVGLAATDPATFCRLLARLVPNEIAAKVESETRLRIIDLSDTREAEPGDIEAVDPGIPPLDLRNAREPAPIAPTAPDPIPAAPAPVMSTTAPPAAAPAAPIFIARPWENEGGAWQYEADLD